MHDSRSHWLAQIMIDRGNQTLFIALGFLDFRKRFLGRSLGNFGSLSLDIRGPPRILSGLPCFDQLAALKKQNSLAPFSQPRHHVAGTKRHGVVKGLAKDEREWRGGERKAEDNRCKQKRENQCQFCWQPHHRVDPENAKDRRRTNGHHHDGGIRTRVR